MSMSVRSERASIIELSANTFPPGFTFGTNASKDGPFRTTSRSGSRTCGEPIGSPQVLEPDLLVVLNGPSFDAFVPNVKPGGKAFIDSSMVDAKTTRTDIDCFYVPATQLADDNNLAKGANIVLLGKLLHETGIFSFETVRKALEKNTPAKRAHTIDNNMAALKLGADYQG